MDALALSALYLDNYSAFEINAGMTDARACLEAIDIVIGEEFQAQERLASISANVLLTISTHFGGS